MHGKFGMGYNMDIMRILGISLLIGFVTEVEGFDSYMRPSNCSRIHPPTGGEHTYCLPRSPKNLMPKNTVFKVSRADQRIIVNTHNALRASASNPTATDMEKMVWDDELARLAQAWAEQCVIGHDKNRHSNMYNEDPGQNGYFGFKNWKRAIRSWYNEIKDFTYGRADGRGGNVIGHFTQMMQHGSVKVGCGYAKCRAEYTHYLFCDYIGPNWSLAKPWTRGRTCSACPKSCKRKLCNCRGLYCFNGGTKNINDCTCACTPEYQGRQCLGEKCTGLRCQNGGTIDTATCTCKCTGLYSGARCDVKACPPKENPACGSHWTKASCKKYYNVPDECPYLCGLCQGCSFVCKNGGTMDFATCKCTCAKGYKGADCAQLSCPRTDDWACAQWPRSYCQKYNNVPGDCPYLCGRCRRGRKWYNY